MARAVLLALVACLALGVAQAQLPLEFLDQLLLTGKDVLTEEQAAMAAGVWNQTGGLRIDGSVADGALRKAAAAALKADTDVDFKAVAAEAITRYNPASGTDFRVFIPRVDEQTGAFLAYYYIALPGGKPTMARLLGFASPLADGGVLLTATKDEDTGIVHMVVRNATSAVGALMEGVEVWDADRTKVLDNQVIAAYTYEKLPASADKAMLEALVSLDPRDASHSAAIAALDRQTHGLSGKASRRRLA